MKLGDTIRQRRQDLNLSQGDLADLVNLSQTYLCLIEANKKQPTMERLKVFSEHLKLPLPFLLLKSLEYSDIPEDKKGIYEGIKGSIDKLIESVMESDDKIT